MAQSEWRRRGGFRRRVVPGSNRSANTREQLHDSAATAAHRSISHVPDAGMVALVAPRYRNAPASRARRHAPRTLS